ncbi:unnamed protein product [Durusdinium trenchii]|uniref:Amine oxidase domain-containing protein n=1 Tax=Durusdinium trenchii TaxID=1381693 RepID=A0ABP0JCV6_9DINO
MSPVNYAGLALYFVVLAISMIASYCSTKSGARRGASGLLIAVTWFYILRFTINYPKTSWYQDGLNLFDVAYADVIWGQETGNWGYTQMLLCWAIVGTVWTINAPLYYQLFGLFGAMSGSYCLILPEHRREREEDRDTVHISLLVACLMAFLCVWMLPMSKTYRELSWWLWGLHVCLIVPKVLGLGRLGPRVHKGIVYLADEVLCVGCGQGQELQFFRERFHPTRLQGLDAHGTRPEAPEEIRVGRVEEMAHGVNHIRCGEFSKILAVDCVYHFQKARFLRDSAKLARESLSMTDVVLRPDAPWWIRLLLCAMNIQWSNHWTEPQYRKALEEAGFSKISWKSLEPHVLSQLPGLSSLAPYLDYVLIHAEVKKHPRPLAAVIGSGMSGLIAAHLLEATHDVVIFEAGPKCGLVGLQEDLGGVAVDVPLRFMMPHYYQELLQVIRQLKIPTKAVPYNAAYQCGDEMLMFTVFFRPELPNETFLEYMKRHKLHDHEAYRIYSLHLSWMLSCTYEQANGTPAGVILGFIRASNPFVRMYQSSGNILRVYPTMRALQDRLLEGKVLKVNSPVAPFNGSREIDGTMYDAVIVATDAPAAGYLLGGEWQAMLSKIHYQKGRIIVHKDPALMPPKKEDWRTFNVREDGPDSTCQITVWLNKFWGRDDLSENLFETWNPAQECSPDLKVKDVQLSRATYTTAMHELWSWIQEKQGQDGFYVAGAYTLEGMSLSLSC